MTIPRRIGKYEIRGVLGQGGAGVVYRAFQPDLGREVALKALVAGEHGSPELLKRFLREARAAAGLSHPGVVQVYDFGAEGSLHYIVMELVPRGSLAELLRTRRLRPDEALRLALRVAEALEAAHARGLVHRDVKPSNILLDAQGRPKLADFGLARSAGDAERLTATGDILGTAWYMAPEQAFGGPEDVDARADVYSLGAVLYEMLTGRPPFDGARAAAVLKRIETEIPAAPSRVDPALDPGLDRLVGKALEKDPARRYAGAAAFRDAIREALERRPGARPAPRGIRTAVVALAAVVLGIVLIVTGIGYRSAPDPVERLRAALAEPRSSAGRAARIQAAIENAGAGADVETLLQRSRGFLELGGGRPALQAATAAVEAGPDVVEARLQRAWLLFLRYGLDHRAAAPALLHARSGAGLEEELASLRRLNATPEDLAWVEGALLGLQQRHAEAADHLAGRRDARGRLVRQAALVFGAAGGEDETGRRAAEGRARAELAASLERDPEDPHVRFLAAWLEAGAGNEAQARRHAERLVGAGPLRFADPFLRRAAVLDRLELDDLAHENLEIARRLDPDDLLVASYRLALRLDRTDGLRADPASFAREARETLAAAAERNPPFPAPALLTAVAQMIEGRGPAAEDLLRKTRLRFGAPASWPERGDWKRAEELPDLLSAAGQPGPLYAYASARFLSRLERPEADALWLDVLARISTASEIPDERRSEIRIAAYCGLAASALRAGRNDAAVEHLRSAIQAGGDLEDLLDDDPRFERLRDDRRIRELRAKRG